MFPMWRLVRTKETLIQATLSDGWGGAHPRTDRVQIEVRKENSETGSRLRESQKGLQRNWRKATAWQEMCDDRKNKKSHRCAPSPQKRRLSRETSSDGSQYIPR